MPHSNIWNVDYVGWAGTEEWVTVKDAQILTEIQKELRPWFGPIRIVQGGLSMGTSSASTHKGLGAFDVSVKNPFTTANDYQTLNAAMKAARVFLRAGLLPFIRGWEIGSYNDNWDSDRHFHVVSWESYNSLHWQAQNQLKEYRTWLASITTGGSAKDGDGLVGAQPYPGPLPPALEHWATSPYNPMNITEDTKTYQVNVGEGSVLYGLDVDRQKVKTRERGFEVQAAKRVQRWGRSNVVTSAGTYYAASFLTEAP